MRHKAGHRALAACRALAATLALAMAAACTSGSADSPYFGKVSPPAGQEMRYISGSEPESLDPPVSSSQPDARIMMALFDGLTEYDPKTGQPIPALATTWEANDDNSVFTFHLRDAKWSDGAPITADDFVYSIRRGLSPALASRTAYMAYDISNAQAYNEGAVFARDRVSGAWVMDPVNTAVRLALPGDEATRTKALSAPALAFARDKEYVPVRPEDVGVDAVDAHTLRFRLRQPVPFVPKLVSHQFFRAVPRQAVERYGDQWTRPGKIVVSGAFIIDVWRPYDVLILKRNPSYYDAGMVRLDTLIFYPVEDLTTMMNLYKAGEVYATFNHTVPSSWVGQVKRYKDYMDAPELATESFVFNTTKGPTMDVRVRHALNMAIDKEALARFRRTVKPTTSSVPLNMFPGYPSPQGDPFDPARAKALLVEAGFRDASGQYDPSRFPATEMEIAYNTSESNRSTAEFIQAQWKQNLGITVSLRNMEFRTFLQTRSRLEYRGIARSGWIGDYMDPFTFLSLYVVEGGDNGSGWSDERFVALLNRANRQHDPNERYRLLAEAEKLLLDAQPTLPLYNNATNYLKKPFVKGMWANPVTMHAWKFVYIEHDPAKWDQVD
ncbi:MAG: peptide ABC transporter substrate-binding protein [Acidobacteria bacterium]|nr:peptide ABC transporter substrate-binding protein [Acidobacteriota bacterium]